MKLLEIPVELTLMEPQLGTVPKNKEVYAKFIIDRLRSDLEKELITQAEFDKRKIEEVESVKEQEDKGWTGFHQDKGGIFIYDYMIRGFLKNAATVLKEQTGLKNQKSKIDSFVFVFPRKIYFTKNGKPVHETHGVLERPLRAQTMQGPRVTLARSDFMDEGCKLSFVVTLVENPGISVNLLKELFTYGKLQGLGQFRNGSYGRFGAKIK